VDVLAEIDGIAKRRNVSIEVQGDFNAGPAAPCSPGLQGRLAAAVTRAGVAPRHLASGAGHDAVSFSGVTDIGMLFVRCGNGASATRRWRRSRRPTPTSRRAFYWTCSSISRAANDPCHDISRPDPIVRRRSVSCETAFLAEL